MRRIPLAGNGERSDQGFMTLGGPSAALRRRIARGDYVVDERAVAEAMLSRMLVPAELFGRRAVGSSQYDAGAGGDGSEPSDG